jgi:ankyrin repeat protein
MQDSFGRTALHWACQAKCGPTFPMVAVLLTAHGEFWHHVSAQATTPTPPSCVSSCLGPVARWTALHEYLPFAPLPHAHWTEVGGQPLNVNARSANGDTPLHWLVGDLCDDAGLEALSALLAAGTVGS